jgi:hypothetical protein
MLIPYEDTESLSYDDKFCKMYERLYFSEGHKESF